MNKDEEELSGRQLLIKSILMRINENKRRFSPRTLRRKKILIAIVLWLVIIVIIYFSIKLPSDEDNEIMANHFDAKGVVTNVGLNTVDVSYSINGSRYTRVLSPPYGELMEGEEFEIMASKKELDRSIVCFEKPIIDTFQYKFGVTKPIDMNTVFFDSRLVLFSYKVGDEEYDREQYFSEGERPEDYATLEVKYRLDKPEIGYLVEIKKHNK
jgi:hypothetical protein